MSRKRKKFLVEKQVQGALGWRIAAHWFAFLGLSLFATCSLQMLGNFESGSLWSSFQQAMLGQIGSIAVLLALLPWFIHDSLKLSNRFAGPMVRLQKSIVELTKSNEVLPVTFRSQDFWQEIAVNFNELQMRVLAERELLAKHGVLKSTTESELSQPVDEEKTLSLSCVDEEKTLPLSFIPGLATGANSLASQPAGFPYA